MFSRKKSSTSPETAAAPTALEKKLSEQAAAEAASPPAAKSLTLAEATAELAETRNRLLRLAADFENFRRRSTREKEDASKYAIQTFLEKLLPVLDNLEMAQKAATDAGASGALHDGVGMILGQLHGVLREAGVEEIHAAGGPFDPALHEAISQQESSDVAEGTVLKQFQKGYKLNGRLVRAARVVVARAPAQPAGN